MKIVHLIIACFYKEGYGYQENILPAKHLQLGNDVTIISHIYGDFHRKEYINSNGVKVVILPDRASFFKKIPIVKSITRVTKGLMTQLNAEKPDIIFIHGLQAIDNLVAINYKKLHPDTQIFADQHGDYYNMPLNSFKNRVVQKVLYRYIAQKIERKAEMIWGVTPWRVKYIREVYHLSKEKTALLVMGGDENKVDWNNHLTTRKAIRDKYGIPQDKFVVITGGKIDKAKNFHLLYDAIEQLSDNVVLLFFGRIEEDMIDFFETHISKKMINLGWINSDDSYAFFEASDLAVFPGTHSVLWEQACASGIPCVFKDWEGGFNHVDLGGNCVVLSNISVSSLRETIEHLSDFGETYKKMKTMAEEVARPYFSYYEIAKRSICL